MKSLLLLFVLSKMLFSCELTAQAETMTEKLKAEQKAANELAEKEHQEEQARLHKRWQICSLYMQSDLALIENSLTPHKTVRAITYKWLAMHNDTKCEMVSIYIFAMSLTELFQNFSEQRWAILKKAVNDSQHSIENSNLFDKLEVQLLREEGEYLLDTYKEVERARQDKLLEQSLNRAASHQRRLKAEQEVKDHK